MKKVILTVSAFIFSLKLMAQAPEKMSYQAVVRNSSNGLVISAPVGMRISILQGSATGASVYTETQTINSNANGLVSLEIGSGTVVSGNFSTIDWSADTYFIKTETDPTGGTTYSVTGTSQLMSVPYALHAKSAESVINNDDADADPANEIELPTGGNNGQVLSTDGSGNYSWNDQTVNTLPDGTNVGQTAHWDGTAWVVDESIFNDGTNVGVGTNSPVAKLTVNGDIQVNNSSVPAGIAMENTGGTEPIANFDVNFRSTGFNTTQKGGSVRVDGRNGAPTIQFLTRPAGSTVETIPLVIAENNNVGIGTITPTEVLDVVGNVKMSGALMPNNTAGTTGQVLTSAGAGAAPTWTTPATSTNIYSANGTLAGNRVVTQGANTLGFTASAVNAFSVDGTTLSVDASNNRVGIGNSAPNNDLHVTTSTLGGGVTVSGPTPGFRLSPTAGATVAFGAANIANEWATGSATNDAVVVNQHATGKLILATGSAAAARMAITPAGNVGVGTTAPASLFSVGANSNVNLGSTLTISNNSPEVLALQGSAAGTNINFFNSGNTQRKALIGAAPNALGASLNFLTTSSTGATDQLRMSINSDGNIGIATLTPVSKLDVVGNGGLTNAMLIRNGNDISTNQSTQIAFGYGNSDQYKHYISTRHNAGGTVNNAMEFYTSDGTANGTIATASQCMSLNGGKVGIGTNSPQVKLHVNAVMRLEPQAAAPATAGKGDMYFNGTTNKLMVFDGSVWQACW